MPSTVPAPVANSVLAVTLKALNEEIARQAISADFAERGRKVELYRKYVEGDQDAKLSKEKLEQLNLPLNVKSAFTANYCNTVIQTMVDRIALEKIESDNESASAWAQELLEENDFEELQDDLHESILRDGDGYLMVSFDPITRKVQLTVEPAWDGASGTMAFYSGANGRRSMTAAVKVWSELDATRVNVYYPSRVEKFTNKGGQWRQYEQPARWLTREGTPIGIPVIHFPNRKRAGTEYGLSELENVIPLQDALNRTIHSMVMSAEHTAFKIRYTIGGPAPDKFAPGTWLAFGEAGLKPDQKIEIGTLEQGEITPFIEQAKFFIHQIGATSRTPLPELMGSDDSSGEALKQREIGLLGKVHRFEKKSASEWRNVMNLAWLVQATFGEQPPQYRKFVPKWKDPQVRNANEIIANAKLVRDDISRGEFLRLVSIYFGWDEKKIEKILQDVEAEVQQRITALGNQLPDFQQADFELGE